MFNKNYLFKFKLYKKNDIIEIGGGEGELSHNLIKLGYNVVLFIEPDLIKYRRASRLLPNIKCLNESIENIDIKKIKSKSACVTVIMQDVIEHIPKINQKKFFEELTLKYEKVNLIGRTPNLKSPFGLRNSFGDNTHIYRFTDKSLREFLKDLGFIDIVISSEPYKVTGLVSLIRYIPYLLIVFIASIAFLFVFGVWEGFLTSNLVFYTNNLKVNK
tara:strand:+ start:619 stop:1266 length:648 start_codon:yes stop_codon:yes gene_type:complete